MKLDYTNEEVREIVDASRDGESLEEVETRLAGQWLAECRRRGKRPVEAVREAVSFLKGSNRD